ncbi:MAG: NADPH-dependent F420 reductase [Trebonia sp.]
MRIGVVGAGRIGGNLARLLTQAGHQVVISYARDAGELRARAAEFGCRAGSVAEAATFGDVVVLSVPWPNIDAVLAEAGSLAGKVVIDTTNHFTSAGLTGLRDGTAAQVNQTRLPDARLVKAYNTLTAGFQGAAAGRTGPDRVVMFLCGDDEAAKAVVAGLIIDTGFTPFDVGRLADGAVMEAPRRPGAVYGEEFSEVDARRFLDGGRSAG